MTERRSIAEWFFSGLFGVLTGLFLVFGYQLEKLDHIDLTDRNAMLVMLMIIVVVAVDTKHVFKGYDMAVNDGKKLFGLVHIDGTLKEKEVSRRDFLTNYLVMNLLCLPVLLAEFPGFFVYDAQEELNEVLTRTFTTHHPLFHVILLGAVIALVHKVTGSWNLGIAAYIVLQMLAMNAIYAYAVTYMQKRGIGRKQRIVWVIFYGAFPTIVMYTLCSCKDGLFSALLFLVTIFLVQLLDEREDFLKNKAKVCVFVCAAALMPLFRHNGFYAYLVFVPFALIYFRKELKSILPVMLILPVVIYLVLSNLLSFALKPSGTHHQEMLTVPIMQIARVYACEGDSISKEDKEIIERYIPKEDLLKYTPRLSDLVKVNFNNALYEEDKEAFFGVWYRLFREHPLTYLNAWLLTSYGYYYPPAAFNVYKGNTVFTFTYEESSYFGYEVEPPGVRTGIIPPVDSLYRYLSLGPFYKDIPVLYLFFAPGTFVLLFMFAFAYRLSKKRTGQVLPFLPMVLTYCTVLLGPTYLIRYVLYLWLCFPLIFVTGGKEKAPV